jgi:hypothetical protein
MLNYPVLVPGFPLQKIVCPIEGKNCVVSNLVHVLMARFIVCP